MRKTVYTNQLGSIGSCCGAWICLEASSYVDKTSGGGTGGFGSALRGVGPIVWVTVPRYILERWGQAQRNCRSLGPPGRT